MTQISFSVHELRTIRAALEIAGVVVDVLTTDEDDTIRSVGSYVALQDRIGVVIAENSVA